MLIYEKKIDNERHLYGTLANLPSEEDSQLTYKDLDGDVITPVPGDTYRDNKRGGIVRDSDKKAVNVFIDDVCVIGEVKEKEVKVLKVTSKPAKTAYVEGEQFDTTGMVVQATYADGDKAEVTGYTTVPANGAVLTTADTKVTVAFGGKTAEFSISVREYVHSTMSTDISEKSFVAGAADPVEFTFSTVANDDAGIIVKGASDFGVKYKNKLAVLDYFNGSTWEGMIGREFGGPGFPMMDASAKFRAAFKADAAGSYSFTASMKRADNSEILCSVDVPFEVVAG